MRDLRTLVALAEQGRRMSPPTARGTRWFDINAESAGRTAVYIYGEIGGWDNPAGDFVRGLQSVTSAVDLHINSTGGSVFDGLAIYAALKNHAPGVDTYVDSIAASAASFIAMAGGQIVMEKPAKMMIHDAAGLVLGNAADMREMADLLDTMSDTLAEIYADRAGGDVAGWRDAMRAESWYSAAQAVEAGLADRVAGDATTTAAGPDNRRSQLIRARARVALRG